MKRKSSTIQFVLTFVLVLLLAMVGTTFAEPSLFPTHVGVRMEYNRRDSIGNEWTVQMELDHQKTIDSLTYFHLQRWNYGNDGAFEDLGYARSTEEAMYMYNPSGPDDLVFQKAPVGTKWSFYFPDPASPELDYLLTEITDIGPVTVPYGTFDTAYLHRKYSCADPDDLSKGQSPYHYEWIVPGVGFVKQVNFWGADNPPLTMELVNVIIPADIDIDPNMLNVQSEGKWITWHIWLPEEYDVADIEPDSILLNGVIEAAWRWIDEEEQVLMAKFSRSDVQAIVEPGEVELTVRGELTDGTTFEGAVMITVID